MLKKEGVRKQVRSWGYKGIGAKWDWETERWGGREGGRETGENGGPHTRAHTHTRTHPVSWRPFTPPSIPSSSFSSE